MSSETLFERRHHALMAFLFLTGARETAAMTVRMGHVDLANACVHFDGRLVETKFGKRFTVAILPVGDTFVAIVRDWIEELRTDLLWGQTDPVFPKTAVGIGATGGFESRGLERAPRKSPARVVKIFRSAFEAVGLPPYSPHSIRRTLVQLSKDHCRTPEEFKAWSQSLGHEDVLTTFMNYGSDAPGRQIELIARRRESPEDTTVIDDA